MGGVFYDVLDSCRLDGKLCCTGQDVDQRLAAVDCGIVVGQGRMTVKICFSESAVRC